MVELPATERRTHPAGAFFARLLLGHFVAYPVGFLAAFASIPVALRVRRHALVAVAGSSPHSAFVQGLARQMRLSAGEGAQLEIVLRFVLYSSVALLLLVHLAVLPWAIAAARRSRRVDRARRMFMGVVATATAVVVVTGVVGWIWLYSL